MNCFRLLLPAAAGPLGGNAARVPLAPGERKTVEITLPWEAFQIVDAEGRSVVEPGDFEVLVGPSSRDRDLLKATLRAE
jgi:hypothetical protein